MSDFTSKNINDSLNIQSRKSLQAGNIKVWVLAPQIEGGDANIDYYYDFTQSIEEYKKVFELLQMQWMWQPINMNNYKSIIDEISDEKETGNFLPVVLNLCDGDEVNGTPGVSVIKLLEEKELVYTGADEFFYNITTSKIPMKQAFDNAGVSTAPWCNVNEYTNNLSEIFNRLGSPIIVKPAVSGGSMGVGVKNVVENEEQLSKLLNDLTSGYRGWNLLSGGIIAEKFVAGPEFTTLISGSYDHPKDIHIYNPVERVFHDSLPENEKFLSFDRLWEIYETESAMPNNENFYEYRLAEERLSDTIKNISRDAYLATKGKGYTRVDLRMDKETAKIYVLEVNAQCGISEDEDYTSIGAILKFSGKTFAGLVEEIIKDGVKRAIARQIDYITTEKIERA
jgi:D-alanine-D-alanine ligase